MRVQKNEIVRDLTHEARTFWLHRSFFEVHRRLPVLPDRSLMFVLELRLKFDHTREIDRAGGEVAY